MWRTPVKVKAQGPPPPTDAGLRNNCLITYPKLNFVFAPDWGGGGGYINNTMNKSSRTIGRKEGNFHTTVTITIMIN